ncbi:MAG TPA: DNA primase DnaG, partial [Thermoplasmata archaeon]|nr:DNA primase DnaG [Thermoplasmata archaeon]HEV2429794.1 DNA primase DnaG [Thermoplasmata archaeon]
MSNDPSAAKYQIRARITAEGVIEKPDVVGAVFGQTEGLLGDELDLRDLQKSGRVGRIEVEIDSRKGKSEGEIIIPSSLDQVETAILASGLETVDRIGPCRAKIEVVAVEDIRISKRQKIVERAKEILNRLTEESKGVGIDLTESVRKAVQVEEITSYGPEHLPAGPNVDQAESLIVVEGRSDVLNLLRCGIKNVIAVEGTSVPQTVKDLSRGKTVTAFTDGDRAGELILREMLQTMDIDFVARAPRGSEVEELTQKQLLKCLRNKIPINQFLEMSGFESTGASRAPMEERPEGGGAGPGRGGDRRDDRGRRDGGERGPPPPRPPMPVTAAPLPPPPPPPPAAVPLPPRLAGFLDLLGGIENTSKSLFLGPEDTVVAEAPVKEMIDRLAALEPPAKTVIFDGVVSQRLLDVAQERGIDTVIANRLGAVGKIPDGLKVLTRMDLTGGR